MGFEGRSAAERLAELEGVGPRCADLVSMVRDGSEVVGEAALNGRGQLMLEASSIRNATTGLHALIRLAVPEGRLVHSSFNVERDEDRTRLANAAAKKLGDAKRYGPTIKGHLDEFCGRIWEVWLQAEKAWWTAPDDSTDPNLLLAPYVQQEGQTILFGAPMSAKTWIAMIWAVGLEHGGLPWAAERCRTLFVNLERSPREFARRLHQVCGALGHEGKPLLSLHRRGRALSDVIDGVASTVKEHKVGCVFVDSLSRMGVGNLNDNEPANRAMDLLASLGVATVVIGHSPRSDDSHVFGSQMFTAAADVCVGVRSIAYPDNYGGQRIGIYMRITKANEIMFPRPEVWALDFEPTSNPHAGRLACLRRSDASEFPDLPMDAVSTIERIRHYLATHGPSSAQDVADDLDISRNRAAEILAAGTKSFHRHGKDGRKVLWSVLTSIPEPE